jgi:hypothetical protein
MADINDKDKLEAEKISDKSGFIYLIQEREFIKTKESIYKIGRTDNFNQRI